MKRISSICRPFNLFLIFLFVLFLRVSYSFVEYKVFVSKPVRELKLKVVNQYKKKNYYVLKLKNGDIVFYTTDRDDLKNLLNETVSLKIFTKNISFWEFLSRFYAVGFDLKLLSPSKAELFIEEQHSEKKLQNLFKALFLGESMDYKTRKELSALGISHLFALSGLHLGFISFFVYFLIFPFYYFFHKKFPYRNRYVDISLMVLAVELVYLHITHYPPSLIRAFVMEIVMFLELLYLEKISFKVLFYTFLFSLALFFNKIFSIGYFLSITGVFYIFLFFRYVKVSFLSSFLLSFYMFGVMFVWSHYFFGNINIFQLFSPVANIVFSLFYPVEALLHLFHKGGVFDGMILQYLSLGDEFGVFKTPFWFVVLFGLFSFAAVRKKEAFYGINLLALLLILYAFKGVLFEM